MNYNSDLNEISAEVLLNYLYPELEDRWKVRPAGTFYRNYNNDTLSVEPDEESVELARDGFLHLLPQGFISEENELREGDKKETFKKIEFRKRLLEEAFMPVDSVAFRRKLRIEREISQLLKDKLNFILKKYFNFEIEKESNAQIRELAVLLPYIRRWRGDLKILCKILQDIFKFEVRLYTGRWSATDSTRQWIPAVRIELIIPSLNSDEYKKLNEEIKPFVDFVKEWFIPVETHFEMYIKEFDIEPVINKNLTLDYNTELYN